MFVYVCMCLCWCVCVCVCVCVLDISSRLINNLVPSGLCKLGDYYQRGYSMQLQVHVHHTSISPLYAAQDTDNGWFQQCTQLPESMAVEF